jgi:hypothetical protein
MHAYQELDSIHADVHRLGTVILDAVKAGQNEEARHHIPQLLIMKDAVINSLSLLQRAVDAYPRLETPNRLDGKA